VNPLKGDLSLIDFGLACPYNNDSPLDRTIAFTGGTSGYAPPEFAKDGKKVWEPEIDVHCFGAMLFYMFYGVKLYGKTPNGRFEECTPSKQLMSLLTACLNPDPSPRLSVNEILNSDWLQRSV